MKLLWVKTDYLHPPNRGGQIRTLETLRRLHRRHRVHYICLDDGSNPEGPARAGEYCSRAYAVPHRVPDKRSAAFAGQLVRGLVSPLPVAVERYKSASMKHKIEQICRVERFDCVVCDFLFPAPNIPELASCVLLQHNVEASIWRRHTENAPTAAHRSYFGMQYRRMLAYEGEVCRGVKKVLAVSETDANAMKQDYDVRNVAAVPTGVDIEYFARPSAVTARADLVFVGSMDWMPNEDGAKWFVSEILPHIRRRRPGCTVSIVGRKPGPAIKELARSASIEVTGTVPDVRPHMWGAAVSIVPLRVGGGTRLKIFEAMAARVPVVSTTIGAEGLPVKDGEQIAIADSPEEFAERCLALLDDADSRRRMTDAAWDLVSSRFSWEAVSLDFERQLTI